MALVRDKLAHNVRISGTACGQWIDVELHVAIVLRVNRLLIRTEHVQTIRQVAHELFAVQSPLLKRIHLEDVRKVRGNLRPIRDVGSIGLQSAIRSAVVVDD